MWGLRSAYNHTLELLRALELLDRPVGNRFLLQVNALEATGDASWPERRDEMIELALTTKSVDGLIGFAVLAPTPTISR